jgi:hypothetical protein
MKKIAVFGSQSWQDQQVVADRIDALYQEHGRFVLVSGGAKGASKFAEAAALGRNLPVVSFRPVKLKGAIDIADEYGVDEWRLFNGAGQIVHHYHPTWADWESAANFRSWLMADRGDQAVAFWDGFSRGTAFEIELFEGREKPCEVVKR